MEEYVEGPQEQPQGMPSTGETSTNPEEVTLDANTQKEIDAFTGLVAKFIHGKENRNNVINLLKAAPVEDTIPAGAIALVEQADKVMGAKKEVSMEAKFAGLLFAINDLGELSNAMGLSQFKDARDMYPIMQSTVQQVVEKGLADGSIDPIELQAATEQIMPPQLKEAGLQMAGKLGLPEKPDPNQAYNRLTDQKVRPLKQENESLKKQMQALKGPPQGQPQQGQGGPPPAMASMFPQGGRQ